MSTSTELTTAQLVIYAIFVPPILYVLFRHGLPGLLGWAYLFLFCTLRMVGAILAKVDGEQSFAANIVSNVGLSPLLLGILGFLHEARIYRNPKMDEKIEWLQVLVYHILVTTGIALLASGASAFKGGSAKSSDEVLLKVGVVILLVSWVILSAWAIFSLKTPQREGRVIGFKEGSLLLQACLIALLLTGLRMFYSTIAILAPSKNLSLQKSSLGIKLALSFVPEVLIVLVFIFIGVLTRGVREDVKRVGERGELGAYGGVKGGESGESGVGMVDRV